MTLAGVPLMIIVLLFVGSVISVSDETQLNSLDFVECPLEYSGQYQLNTTKYDQLIAECSFANVPFEYSNSSTEEISIFVKRIRKRNQINTKRKIIWFVPGGGLGPGLSSAQIDLEMIKYYTMELYSRNDNYQYSIYSIEHRGVGRSSRLSCELSQSESPSSDGGYLITNKEWSKCAKDLSKQKTSQFSSDNAARDLFTIMKKVQLEQGETLQYLYGYYYGAFWIMKMLKVATQLNEVNLLSSVKGVMLENPFTSHFHFNSVDDRQKKTLEHFLALCSDESIAKKYDNTCSQKFKGKDLNQFMKDVMKKVYLVDFDSHSSTHSGGGGDSGGGSSDHGSSSHSNTPCGLIASKLPFANLTRIFGSLLRSRNGQVIIPAILYRLDRCDESKDIHVLYNLVKYYSTYIESKKYSTDYQLNSDSLFYNVAFSEFWEELHVSESEITSSMQKSFLNNGLYLKYAQVWNATHHWEGPGTYTSTIDSTFTNPTNIPILVLHGDSDPFIDSTSSSDFENSLSGTNHQFLKVSFSLPPTIINSPVKGKSDCSSQILTSLLTLSENSPTVQQVNSQCLNELQFNFTGSSYFSKTVLQVGDIYDGEYEYLPVFSGTVSLTLYVATVLGISIGFIIIFIIFGCVICTMRLTCLNTGAYKKLTSSTASGQSAEYWQNL